MQPLRSNSKNQRPSFQARLHDQPFAVEGKAIEKKTRAASTGSRKISNDSSSHHSSLPLLGTEKISEKVSQEESRRISRRSGSVSKVQCMQQGGQKPHALKTGANISIGFANYEISTLLGSGSFGRVWAAIGTAAKPVAVKEIFCKNQRSVNEALQEASTLRYLTKHLPSEAARRIPMLFGHEVVSIGQKNWQVCLAMTRVLGRPISNFLEARRSERTQRSEWGSLELRSAFGEDCRLAHEFVAQLAPTFEYISPHVFHRDINSKNIMIDDSSGAPQFIVIDFGLAVDTLKWRQALVDLMEDGKIAKDQQLHLDAVGQGCYWPVSSWFVFERGVNALSQYPDLCLEFGECLDFHALGMVALQIVAADLPLGHEVTYYNPRECLEADILISKLSSLHRSWRRYWKTVRGFWSHIIGTAQKGGDMEAVRVSFAKNGLRKILQKDLKLLHVALSELNEVCESEKQLIGLSRVSGLLAAILTLISGAGSKLRRAPCWKNISACVGKSDGCSVTISKRLLAPPLAVHEKYKSPLPSTSTAPTTSSLLLPLSSSPSRSTTLQEANSRIEGYAPSRDISHVAECHGF